MNKQKQIQQNRRRLLDIESKLAVRGVWRGDDGKRTKDTNSRFKINYSKRCNVEHKEYSQYFVITYEIQSTKVSNHSVVALKPV